MRHNPQRELWYSRPVTARTVINPSQAMRAALAERQRGKHPWSQFAADRLATSLHILVHWHFGASRTNKNAFIHIQPDTRRSLEQRIFYIFLTLKTSLCLAVYIGRLYLPK